MFAMDFDNYITYAKSESWMEVKTEPLNHQITRNSSSFLINDKQCRLKYTSERNQSKSILIDGLKKGESVHAIFQISKGSGGLCRYLSVILQSKPTEYIICKDERIDKVELVSISSDLKCMDDHRISEIAKIIDTIDLLLIENAKPFKHIKQITPASSTSSLNKELTALEQLKFMF